MRKRLRKKLRVKEFKVREWFIGFKFIRELSEPELDEFWNKLSDFIFSKSRIYYGGGTDLIYGNFIFFGDPEPKYQLTREKMIDVFKWFSLNKYIKELEMHDVTDFTEKTLDDLFDKYSLERIVEL